MILSWLVVYVPSGARMCVCTQPPSKSWCGEGGCTHPTPNWSGWVGSREYAVRVGWVWQARPTASHNSKRSTKCTQTHTHTLTNIHIHVRHRTGCVGYSTSLAVSPIQWQMNQSLLNELFNMHIQWSSSQTVQNKFQTVHYFFQLLYVLLLNCIIYFMLVLWS